MAFPTSEAAEVLSSAAPQPGQVRLAAWVVAALVLASLLAAPFAEVSLHGTGLMVPAYGAAFLLNEVITAVLLLASFWVRPSPAILMLATGYLFSGLLVIPWVLTFPGVFGPEGLLDAGLQGTAAIAAVRRIGFPLVILLYVLLKDGRVEEITDRRRVRRAILGCAGGSALAAAAFTLLVVTAEGSLPRLMLDEGRVAPIWHFVPIFAASLCVVGIALLWRLCRSLLDLWLIVVLATVLIELFLISFLGGGGRFTVGWWAGRICGLVSASLVLFVLLAETTALYGRLLRSVAAERRVREARMAGLEALSASIAHEVSQPLSSMVTNADAGLRWLDRPSPQLEEVRAALVRIGADGERASGVIDGIRALFGRGRRERGLVDVNETIGRVLDALRPELENARVSTEARLAPRLPRVLADSFQLRQVVSNLIVNALDSMAGVSGRPRSLRVTTGRGEKDEVLVTIEDSGTGVDAALARRMFEPFVTTKSHGMGMGLMICRSIVESHGGRLWLARSGTAGAAFAFSLPADPEVAEPEGAAA